MQTVAWPPYRGKQTKCEQHSTRPQKPTENISGHPDTYTRSQIYFNSSTLLLVTSDDDDSLQKSPCEQTGTVGISKGLAPPKPARKPRLIEISPSVGQKHYKMASGLGVAAARC